MTMLPAPRVPGRTWTVRLTGHADHTVSVTCSTGACRMPPRSKDAAAMRRFAAEHARAHARLATVRADAACACGAADCSFHEDARASCAGAPLLLLVHNPAVGQVWTLAEICQACAPLIPHTAVLGRAPGSLAARPASGPEAAAPAAAAARVVVAAWVLVPRGRPRSRQPQAPPPRRAPAYALTATPC